MSTNTRMAEAARRLDDAIKDLPDGCEGWLEPLDEHIAELRAALAAHDAEQEPCHDAWRAALAQRREPQWQPIETLPDDTLAILHGAKRSEMVIGMRHSHDGWVIDTPSEWASMYPPKHWMPLPAAPGATTGKEPGAGMGGPNG